ncbi:Complex 1 protein (LYR family) [Ceratobasidium sp. AG-Ba]|nr:Complex 1 protein (LYR family) [Ceratobasidium sp. AG-Ba]QRW01932.1 Complex 1 protein (LYR family) [Ceratobasidium sp. AG-Ba]
MASPFSSAHRLHVKSLYKRYLTDALNWSIRRDLWRNKAIEIRAEFERNRNVKDPRAIAQIMADAEARLAAKAHPDPYIHAMYPGGTKWCIIYSASLSNFVLILNTSGGEGSVTFR